MSEAKSESGKSVIMIVISVFVIIIGVVAMASWAFATYLFSSTGYLLEGYHTDYYDDISSDPELSEISQKYFGVNANEVSDYLLEKSQKSPPFSHLYANLWSRKTARKTFFSKHDKFVRNYESIAKTVSKIGVPAYNWIMLFGYLGISFIGIIIVLFIWLNPLDDSNNFGGSWHIFSDGTIGMSGGSQLFSTLLLIGLIVAIAVFLAPIINLILAIGIFAFGIYSLITQI